MDFGLNGKKALVTGAGRGLGGSIAVNLAEEGAKVAVVSRTESDLKKVLEAMGGAKNGHYMAVADLAKEGAPASLMDEIRKNFGDVDMVVNNLGGTLEYRDPFCPISAWREVFRLNLEVAVELNNLAIPHMRKQKWGRIINVSSIGGFENQGPVPYCSVKASLIAYTRSMGRFLAPDGIIMAAVAPGAVFTEGGYWDVASKEKPGHVSKYLADRMAIHRFGTPDEIGSVVAFLCSKHASFCVGSIVPVDGGQGRTFFNFV